MICVKVTFLSSLAKRVSEKESAREREREKEDVATSSIKMTYFPYVLTICFDSIVCVVSTNAIYVLFFSFASFNIPFALYVFNFKEFLLKIS